jgi:hypothetical protein
MSWLPVDKRALIVSGLQGPHGGRSDPPEAIWSHLGGLLGRPRIRIASEKGIPYEQCHASLVKRGRLRETYVIEG